MKNEGVLYVAAAVLSLAWLMTPGNDARGQRIGA